MDPISIVSIIESSVSLALQCGSSAKRLNELASQYKNAKLAVVSMSQNLNTMELAWGRIIEWSKDVQYEQGIFDIQFWQRLGGALVAGTAVLEALENDLSKYKTTKLTFSRRSRLIWNQTLFEAHQNRIRDQASSMTLLLSAIKL